MMNVKPPFVGGIEANSGPRFVAFIRGQRPILGMGYDKHRDFAAVLMEW